MGLESMGLPQMDIAQGVIGGIQSIVGGIRARKAQKELTKMIDSYKPNASILDYYNKALQRYNANPLTSQLYNQQQQQIKAGTAQGLSYAQDRRSALAALPSLIQGQNNSLLKAGVAAEDQQGAALNQLGGATEMKANENKYKYENKLNLLSAKAAAGSAQSNAGMQNLFNGFGNASNFATMSQYLNGGANTGNNSKSSNATGDALGSQLGSILKILALG